MWQCALVLVAFAAAAIKNENKNDEICENVSLHQRTVGYSMNGKMYIFRETTVELCIFNAKLSNVVQQPRHVDKSDCNCCRQSSVLM